VGICVPFFGQFEERNSKSLAPEVALKFKAKGYFTTENTDFSSELNSGVTHFPPPGVYAF
jgi:hypothetical protein